MPPFRQSSKSGVIKVNPICYPGALHRDFVYNEPLRDIAVSRGLFIILRVRSPMACHLQGSGNYTGRRVWDVGNLGTFRLSVSV